MLLMLSFALIRSHSPWSVYNLQWQQALETPLRSSVPWGVPFQYLQQELHIHLCNCTTISTAKNPCPKRSNKILSMACDSWARVMFSLFLWPMVLMMKVNSSSGQVLKRRNYPWSDVRRRAASWCFKKRLSVAEAYLLTIFFHIAANESHKHLYKSIKSNHKAETSVTLSFHSKKYFNSFNTQATSKGSLPSAKLCRRILTCPNGAMFFCKTRLRMCEIHNTKKSTPWHNTNHVPRNTSQPHPIHASSATP